MAQYPSRNVASTLYLDTDNLLVPSRSIAATGYTTGTDRENFASAMIIAATGAKWGSPTSFSVVVTPQHSDSASSGYVDIPSSIGGASLTITTVNTLSSLAVDLSGAKKYMRLKIVVTFVGGSSPTVDLSVIPVWGGCRYTPASTD